MASARWLSVASWRRGLLGVGVDVLANDPEASTESSPVAVSVLGVGVGVYTRARSRSAADRLPFRCRSAAVPLAGFSSFVGVPPFGAAGRLPFGCRSAAVPLPFRCRSLAVALPFRWLVLAAR